LNGSGSDATTVENVCRGSSAAQTTDARGQIRLRKTRRCQWVAKLDERLVEAKARLNAGK
jgi:hypothetical protein